MEDWQNGGFGIYIHWPFCQSKCPYCDFNSHVSARIDQNEWADAYVSEIDRIAALTPGRLVNSVFFGGGTPSLMEPATVERVLSRISNAWTLANDIEITLEANPGSVEAERFAGYRSAGVNRVSMGVQALNDTDLARLGRRHTAAEAMAAFDIARATFDRVSFDLIYARQDQTLQQWEAELRTALALQIDHLSLYQLTIEDGTPFAERRARGGLKGLPDEDLAADMYDLTQTLCNDAGLPAYEVSNHAKDGAASRHNLIYWRMGDYAGIGPGAHGRLTLEGQRIATEEVKAPGAWLAAMAERPRDFRGGEIVSRPDQATELALMSMRLSEGMDIARYEALRDAPLPAARIRTLLELGLVTQSEGRLRATSTGRPVLNGLLRELLAD